MAIVTPQILLQEWNKNNGPQESLSKLYSEGLQQYWDWLGDVFYDTFGIDDFGLAVAADLPEDATSEELKHYAAAHDFAAKLNFLNTEVFDKERTTKGLNLADSSWPGVYLGGTPTEDEPIVYDYAYYKAEVVPVFVQIIEDLKVIQENIFYSTPPSEIDKYFKSYAFWSWLGSDHAPPENIGELIDGVIDSAPGFLKLFGIKISLAKDIPPLPETTGLGPAPIVSDINLENSINFSTGNTNHYIGFLLDPKKSNGKRENKYLPVRLSPGNDPEKLALGWADPKYSLVDPKGKFSNPSNKNKSLDGIEIPLGLEITVVEIVPSETGMWVGFVSEDPKLLDLPTVSRLSASKYLDVDLVGLPVGGWDAVTNEQRRLLYTRAEYVRIKEGAIYQKPDPYISEKAIVGVRSSAVGQSIESVISIKGIDPINPLESQGWAKN